MKKKTRQDQFLDKVAVFFDNGDNIFPKPMTDTQFRRLITDYLLGEKWYHVNPVPQEQSNVYIANAIIEKFNVKENK